MSFILVITTLKQFKKINAGDTPKRELDSRHAIL